MLFAAHYLCSSSFSSLGGFQAGDTSNNPGNTVVERAIALNEPIIYVSANYRLSGEFYEFIEPNSRG
jgi:hypothetical protein